MKIQTLLQNLKRNFQEKQILGILHYEKDLKIIKKMLANKIQWDIEIA